MVRYSLDEVSLMVRRSSSLFSLTKILTHDRLFEFGWCLDGWGMFIVQTSNMVVDRFTLLNGLRDVLHLLLDERDAGLDHEFSLILRFLLARGVFWECGFGSRKDEGLAIDSSEGDVSDSTRKVLNRGVGVELYLCHWCNDFLPCCRGGL